MYFVFLSTFIFRLVLSRARLVHAVACTWDWVIQKPVMGILLYPTNFPNAFVIWRNTQSTKRISLNLWASPLYPLLQWIHISSNWPEHTWSTGNGRTIFLSVASTILTCFGVENRMDSFLLHTQAPSQQNKASKAAESQSHSNVHISTQRRRNGIGLRHCQIPPSVTSKANGERNKSALDEHTTQKNWRDTKKR